ncbi:tetratricopeptide repeat protein [Lutimonas zeaxanthinifaciens]|uniref:tetratricopeptide repeat protein n=1 Tax=Lutimonas zeaxanthinifaciens TaxID=3060215 RepID=UPI00265C9A20|nr:hypothetical protein [Lutimonas sp. YSD2104]WKK66364.1 hypothetical protein QZH61_01800 [Lutimonas sp. YSD2104]
MKSKVNLFIFIFSSFIILLLFFNIRFSDSNLPVEKIGMNPIKCTPSTFLLEGVDSTRQIAPLFENLGSHQFKITTKNNASQTFFNQGLNLAFAFNHSESHRSFLEAARLDPEAAMNYWGQAYVLGPNINDQIPDAERRMSAYEAIQEALKKKQGTSKKEMALIEALSNRYSKDSLADLKELNINYMEAMKSVAEEFPADADVLTLYAASIMNTVPWDYWDKNGNPSPNIKEAKQALEQAMEINPSHPGTHHYYIHMVELPKPDMAVPSAEKLAGLMPGAGHMVHMPGHIYMRVGRYKEAVEANEAAILVDEDYISQCYAQGQYPLGYYPHNIHFLWSAATMMGNEAIAIEAAKKTAEKVSVSNLDDGQFFQNFAATPMLAYMRFGKWNEILTIPDPGDDYSYLKMIWTFTRGVAFTRKGNLKEAKEELEVLENRNKDLDHENISKVAFHVLAGEIAASSGDIPQGIEQLKLAVGYEDQLPYDEPSVWYVPTRQVLGNLLILNGQYEEAEKVYLEDLAYYRQNGWSLMGLYKSLKAQKKIQEAEEVMISFKKAWKHADIEIESSVL